MVAQDQRAVASLASPPADGRPSRGRSGVSSDVSSYAIYGDRQRGEALWPLLQVRVGRWPLGLAADRFLDRRAELRRQAPSRCRRAARRDRGARGPTLIPSAVCGSTTIRCRECSRRIVAMPIGMRADTGDEPGGDDALPVRRAGKLEAAVALDACPAAIARWRDRGRPRRTRSARSSTPWRCPSTGSTSRASRSRRARAVAPGAEEFVERRRSRWSRGSGGGSAAPSARATCPARMLPKLPDGTAKSTGSPSRRRHGEIAAEVVDDLRGDARPVDRVDRADAVARLERRRRRTTAFTMSWQSSNTPSIAMLWMLRVGERVHLRLLERAHPALAARA